MFISCCSCNNKKFCEVQKFRKFEKNDAPIGIGAFHRKKS